MRSKSPDWKYGNHGMLWFEDEGNERESWCYIAWVNETRSQQNAKTLCESLVDMRCAYAPKNLPPQTASQLWLHPHQEKPCVSSGTLTFIVTLNFRLSLCFKCVRSRAMCSFVFTLCSVTSLLHEPAQPTEPNLLFGTKKLFSAAQCFHSIEFTEGPSEAPRPETGALFQKKLSVCL